MKRIARIACWILVAYAIIVGLQACHPRLYEQRREPLPASRSKF